MKIGSYGREFVLNRIPRQTPEWISRGYTLFFILSLVIVFGALTLVPSIISAIQEEKWISLSALSGAYATVLIILFKKNLSYYVRSYILCFCVAVAGYVSISSIGLISSARLWFLCSAVLACLLIGGKSAFVVFLISFIVFVWFGYKTDFAINLPSEPDHIVWIITSATFILVNILVVGATYLIVSGLKKAESSLRESEERFRLFAELAPIGIILSDRQENTLYVSPKFTELFGYTISDIPSVNQWWSLAYPDEELGNRVRREWKTAIDQAIKNRHEIKPMEYPVTCKDGTVRQIEFRIRATDDLNVIVFSDITERKEAEEARKKLHAQLTQAQKMESVGRLAGGVAHDFNNMLGVIHGHTELALLQADENHDLHTDLKEIQNAATRSATLTKQLLAFARKEIISPRQLDLNDTVESMLNMLRRLIGEDIDLLWKPAAHIWPVKMDPSQIDQILANLCINARDAISGVGKLTIETGRKTFDEKYCSEHTGFIPGDFVLLAVSDNGCGMDKDTLDNLFEPFFTTKDVGQGTGLGLATVYGIVKQNNGFINVYSEPGQGSTFKIYLPRFVSDEDTDKAVPEKKAAAGGTETVLLVEDEPTILRMSRMMLEKKGYTVISAARPAEALEKAGNHSGFIDLLMTDVVMPEMNGRDLAGKISELYPGIRHLFMSGYTANVIAHQGVLDDGVAFIQKPFSMADMTEKVREVLDTDPDKNQG